MALHTAMIAARVLYYSKRGTLAAWLAAREAWETERVLVLAVLARKGARRG